MEAPSSRRIGAVTHRVRFLPTGHSVWVPAGTTLLAAALEARVPVARACAGEALCGRCGLAVLGDPDALSAAEADEERAKARNRVAPELRLACCARVFGDVEATASYW